MKRKILGILILLVLTPYAVSLYLPKRIEPDVFIMGLNGSGSGIFISPTKVLTARHVVHLNFAKHVIVLSADGILREVEDIIFLQKKDAAVLILKKSAWVDVPKITTDVPKMGDDVYYTGSPLTLMCGRLLRKGYVASLYTVNDLRYQHPLEPFPEANVYRSITIMAETAPGDSGSGVYDKKGRVFGIVVTASGRGWTGVLPVSEFEELIK